MKPRRRARVLILHGLYQMDVVDTPLEEVVRTIREEAEDQDSLNYVEEKSRPSVLDFFEVMLRGIWEQRSSLDRLLEERAHNWSWDRIARVERNVLRMGAYELLHRPDIPATVSIDEALEIARDYGDERSGAFVNGVLDAIRKTAAGEGLE